MFKYPSCANTTIGLPSNSLLFSDDMRIEQAIGFNLWYLTHHLLFLLLRQPHRLLYNFATYRRRWPTSIQRIGDLGSG